MKDILIIVLEKVKSGALTVEEGVIILEKLMDKDSKQTQSYKSRHTSDEWNKRGAHFEEKIKQVFSKIMNAQDDKDWDIIADKIEKKIKKTVKEWSNKENPKD